MDFIIDYAKVADLCAAINDGVTSVDENIDYTYRAVDAMNEGWGGEEYEKYRKTAYSYKPYLDAIKSVYRVYKHLLENQFSHAFIIDFRRNLKDAKDLMGD